ncbi:unnamed protein product (macronuclear) [Paramecium tetraurelia]|uniref:Paired domain-containing protein n=1 Tax=Paramecium tetraurelia TaxID=5888 RepID=A0DYS7_PARTE|nr:uncharacterized protein GSPATT00003162001 [Paramecium tetraurelia]CAK88194.1 unnamed protein product [Paramecium tetraurelia]|eukprot:XP_001455591.1 hypothetical protein (macronuclear) [Paramecium tetraurelia strain d4-2]
MDNVNRSEENIGLPNSFDNLKYIVNQLVNRKNNRPSQYQKVDENIRQQIIDQACNKGQPLRQISQQLGIKYSTAKAIVQVYQNEGRIGKKRNRDKRIFQEIETFMVVVHKQSGKIDKLKHKSECSDLKSNLECSKMKQQFNLNLQVLRKLTIPNQLSILKDIILKK